MNRAARLAYGAAGHVARALAAVAPAGREKFARTFAARRGIRDRFAAWSAARDTARPLLWMHAPSVGEGLQARVVLELVRGRRPDVQLAYTFYSPSAESFAHGLDVDFTDYLPFDTVGDAHAVLNALRPSAIVFSKLDVWPLLSEEALRQGVRLGMISGTLAQGSSRRGALATHVLRDAYASLERVGAVSDDDAERLVALGVRREAVVVTGDTRYDQVWARAQRADRNSTLLAPLISNRPTLVAGSTWPSDERVLLDAWRVVRREMPDARLVIAPHEPTPEHLAPIEEWAAAAGLSHARLGEARTEHDVVLVDRTGVLGDLYALADAAFVGGGFHGAGLHSVIEPAAFGAPVMFGPEYRSSRDAHLMLRGGGGDAVASPDEATETLVHWLGDPALRAGAGERAQEVVRRGLGAAERSFELVSALLPAARMN